MNYTDIGTATKPGNKTINQGQLEIVAGGSDIWGTHDEFYFGYKLIKGDFDIRVQILGLGKTHLYTKAGIMARVDLSDSCQQVLFPPFI